MPKGEGSGIGAPNSPIADDAPPAEMQSLSHTSGTCTERGKPVDFLADALSIRESEPQGTLMGLRVWDGGRSECHPVMGWIGVEPSGNITPRESGLTSYPGRSSQESLANCRGKESR